MVAIDHHRFLGVPELAAIGPSSRRNVKAAAKGSRRGRGDENLRNSCCSAVPHPDLHEGIVYKFAVPRAFRKERSPPIQPIIELACQITDTVIIRSREIMGVPVSAGDLTFALRTLGRSRSFAIVAILSLAIGIGATTAIVSAVDAALIQPLPYRDPGQLVRIYQADLRHPDDRNFVTPVHYLAFRSRMASFSAAAAMYTYDETGADIGNRDGARRIRTLQVSADYLDVVRDSPVLGRGFRPEEEVEAPVAIVSYDLWRETLGGDPAAVGRTLTLNGVPTTIIGVMPAPFP